ncbi:MAG: hypothetical protein WEB13_09670 [Dehalococcoidia bacterium]
MTDRMPNRPDALADLTAAERLDLATAARAAVRVVAEQLAAGSALDLAALAAAVADGALAAYVDGRMAGLCHDGALELFSDAADGEARAVCEARRRRTG